VGPASSESMLSCAEVSLDASVGRCRRVWMANGWKGRAGRRVRFSREFEGNEPIDDTGVEFAGEVAKLSC
jgi:hypothetical protein